jgi:hypothetical protein
VNCDSNEAGNGEGKGSGGQATAMATAMKEAMVTAKTVVGDKEDNGNGGKSNGDGNKVGRQAN